MIPAANPPDSRRPLAAIGLTFALLLGIAVALGVGGCSKPPTQSTDGSGGAEGPKVDGWKATATKLRKETDFQTIKSALGALGGEKLPAMSDEALNALAGVVPLSSADRAELRGAAYSGQDAAYLTECLYLRDCARSLALGGLPPEHQADLAFAWVCRQVYLNPWPRKVGTGHEPTVLPPTAVLRRGFGSGLERMYVFLALLQQLELDACLIGPPDAGNLQSREGPALTYPLITHVRVQRGPFWAVGVRTGTDVRLFDPWRGAAFPVPLGQLKANPEAAKAWFEAQENISAATLDDAKRATVFLAVPVNALSARMAVFEANMRSELVAKLAFDQKALEAKRAAFPDPKPAYWNPPDDAFAYGRVSRSFLPVDLGGTDAGPVGARLYDDALRTQIPADAFNTPEGLDPRSDAASRVRTIAAGGLAVSFLEPPNPRERIQRGQFQDAAKDIVAKQDVFANGLERLRLNRDADQQIREWIVVAEELYQSIGAARLDKNKERENAAQQAVEVHWRQTAAQLLIDRVSAEVGRAEGALLLALCKHEQAERLQARLERVTGADAPRLKSDATEAWKTALSAWRTYEQVSSAHAGFPGRSAHARALAARAAKLAEAK